jgi:pimeloyl-ACP methyl ester carboxylesterase
MRAAVVHSAAGALLLTALAAAPAGGAPERPGAAEGPGAAERRGTEVAAARAAAAGISFGPCPGAADLPGALRCGTVTVPLDYARPEAAAEAENASAVYTAVECNDAPWPTDFRVWDRDNTRLARRAPFETWENVWTNLPCAYWPAPRQRPLEVRTGPGELPPTLLLAGERDGATPYEGALELRRRLAGSVLVTERGTGTHGVAAGPNACVNGHLEAYLLEGRLPARDAFCAPRPAPEPTSPSESSAP